MKKLFLQSGKLMLGDFPEEPKWHEIPATPSGCDYEIRDEQRDEYNAAVSAAKASAVEVDDSISLSDCLRELHIVRTGEYYYDYSNNSVPSPVKEGQLYDLPKGWTVEIEDYRCPKCGYTHEDTIINGDHWMCTEKIPKRIKIARLVPDLSILESKASGIVATGVPDGISLPEAEHFTRADVKNLMDIASKAGYRQRMQEESVSPPPQAESVINLEALKRICYHFAGIVAPGWQPNAGSAFDSEWDEWLSTGKIVDWHQHRDDAKEVVKVEDLTRKP